MTRPLAKRWPAFGFCLLAGCSSLLDARGCPALLHPALTIEIRELGSGRPLADSARGVARAGTFADSLQPYAYEAASGKLYALQAYGPAGTYRVDLQRPGFQPWAQDNISVTSNRCGDNTVAVRADLVPAATP